MARLRKNRSSLGLLVPYNTRSKAGKSHQTNEVVHWYSLKFHLRLVSRSRKSAFVLVQKHCKRFAIINGVNTTILFLSFSVKLQYKFIQAQDFCYRDYPSSVSSEKLVEICLALQLLGI